jgi:hypothetical protein
MERQKSAQRRQDRYGIGADFGSKVLAPMALGIGATALTGGLGGAMLGTGFGAGAGTALMNMFSSGGFPNNGRPALLVDLWTGKPTGMMNEEAPEAIVPVDRPSYAGQMVAKMYEGKPVVKSKTIKKYADGAPESKRSLFSRFSDWIKDKGIKQYAWGSPEVPQNTANMTVLPKVLEERLGLQKLAKVIENTPETEPEIPTTAPKGAFMELLSNYPTRGQYGEMPTRGEYGSQLPNMLMNLLAAQDQRGEQAAANIHNLLSKSYTQTTSPYAVMGNRMDAILDKRDRRVDTDYSDAVNNLMYKNKRVDTDYGDAVNEWGSQFKETPEQKYQRDLRLAKAKNELKSGTGTNDPASITASETAFQNWFHGKEGNQFVPPQRSIANRLKNNPEDAADILDEYRFYATRQGMQRSQGLKEMQKQMFDNSALRKEFLSRLKASGFRGTPEEAMQEWNNYIYKFNE